MTLFLLQDPLQCQNYFLRVLWGQGKKEKKDNEADTTSVAYIAILGN